MPKTVKVSPIVDVIYIDYPQEYCIDMYHRYSSKYKIHSSNTLQDISKLCSHSEYIAYQCNPFDKYDYCLSSTDHHQSRASNREVYIKVNDAILLFHKDSTDNSFISTILHDLKSVSITKASPINQLILKPYKAQLTDVMTIDGIFAFTRRIIASSSIQQELTHTPIFVTTTHHSAYDIKLELRDIISNSFQHTVHSVSGFHIHRGLKIKPLVGIIKSLNIHKYNTNFLGDNCILYAINSEQIPLLLKSVEFELTLSFVPKYEFVHYLYNTTKYNPLLIKSLFSKRSENAFYKGLYTYICRVFVPILLTRILAMVLSWVNNLTYTDLEFCNSLFNELSLFNNAVLSDIATNGLHTCNYRVSFPQRQQCHELDNTILKVVLFLMQHINLQHGRIYRTISSFVNDLIYILIQRLPAFTPLSAVNHNSPFFQLNKDLHMNFCCLLMIGTIRFTCKLSLLQDCRKWVFTLLKFYSNALLVTFTRYIGTTLTSYATLPNLVTLVQHGNVYKSGDINNLIMSTLRMIINTTLQLHTSYHSMELEQSYLHAIASVIGHFGYSALSHTLLHKVECYNGYAFLFFTLSGFLAYMANFKFTDRRMHSVMPSFEASFKSDKTKHLSTPEGLTATLGQLCNNTPIYTHPGTDRTLSDLLLFLKFYSVSIANSYTTQHKTRFEGLKFSRISRVLWSYRNISSLLHIPHSIDLRVWVSELESLYNLPSTSTFTHPSILQFLTLILNLYSDSIRF